MTQNRSAAIMQQRREPPDSLDYFPTPPWAARALCHELGEMVPIGQQSVWEPACGEGDLLRGLSAFGSQRASDIHHYGPRFPAQAATRDFLAEGLLAGPANPVDWVITNPPFNLALDFVWRALEVSQVGAAFFLRNSFAEGQTRYDKLFRDRPPSFEFVFAERVVLWKNHCLDPDVPVWRETTKADGTVVTSYEKPTTATTYSWFVWIHDEAGDCRKRWIPPSRKDLERRGDYPELPDRMKPPAGALIGGAA